MDYAKILRRAYDLTVKHKFLWLFGFLVALTSGGMNFNFNFSTSGMPTEFPNIAESIGDFVSFNWILILVVLAVLLLFFLGIWLLSVLAQGGLIGSADKLDKGQKSGIKDGFGIGAHCFWRMLGLSILIGLIVFLTIIILGTPVFILFYYQMWVRAVLLLILALFILVPETILLNLILKYAQRFIVLKDKGIIESMRLGFEIIKKNLGPTILIALILIGINILIGIGFLILMVICGIIIGIPLVLLGIILWALINWVGVVLVVILGLLLLFLIAVFVRAIITTFNYNVWTLAFKELKKD